MAPVVGAWDANDSYVLVDTGETCAQLTIVCRLDVCSMAHLLRWSLVCQRPIPRSVECFV